MHSVHEAMRYRSEQPPYAPYDPPQPAPQAAAWHQALKVIGCAPRSQGRIAKTALRRDKWWQGQ
jgi:hypothetical protein